MADYIINNGEIEISFDGIPSQDIRTKLKGLSYRWDPMKKVWHASNNPARLELAENLSSGNIEAVLGTPEAKVIKIEMNRNCCYYSTVAEFLTVKESQWLSTMKSAFNEEYILSLGESQVNAWKDCFQQLQIELQKLPDETKASLNIIFEYALPYESGRRPDVILLNSEQVIILEFKMKSTVYAEDIDQVVAYARDIREYHYQSWNKKVFPNLVLTRCSIPTDEYESLTICSSDHLSSVIKGLLPEVVSACDPDEWMNSKYAPLPTIVDAARLFMNNEELPNIRRVNSTGIPAAVELLSKITGEAKQNKDHILALVTGVPGAGKTFLGLNFVYKVCESNENANSVYLSGNGPLITVLQDALQSNVFVQDVHKVVNQYVGKRMASYDKNIIVFDEGQRAWSQDRMSEKRGTNKSEPDIFVEIADSLLDWSVLLILVGEGQEINTGEHGGLSQWNDALASTQHNWKVVCPSKLQGIFRNVTTTTDDCLNLTTSLRSHTSINVSAFVNSLIAGKIDEAKEMFDTIDTCEFPMWITRDLDRAKIYCQDRYKSAETKRYGLLASSKAYNLSKYGMKPQFRPDVASWFNRPPQNPNSCCSLRTTISEFDCQGLEIDMPIIGWGTDLTWNGTDWNLYKPKEAPDSEANIYRLNSYRVLLTRGRDGFIIFVPDDRELDSTYNLLKEIGLLELQ